MSKDTISRWCKTVMRLSGIDVQKNYTHSTRSVVSSKAKSIVFIVMLLKNIIKCVGWKSEKRLFQHYDKQVEKVLDIRFQQNI